MFASLEAKLLAAVAIAVVAFGLGWKWRDDAANKQKLNDTQQVIDNVRARLVETKALSEADAAGAKSLEELLSGLAEKKAQIIVKKEKEYVAYPAYSGCLLPPSGLSILNDAITAGNTAIQNSGKR